jgi:hypothetical protein
MMLEKIPQVGNWYKTQDNQEFEVVAVDDDEGFIEIQYFGGELDEFDFDSWATMGFTEIAPPEDWSGPFDDLERDDLGYTDTNVPPEHRGFSVEDFDKGD